MRVLGLDVSWSRPKPEARSITLADFPQLNLNPPSVSGVSVTESTALNFSAYYNGVDIISGQVASLPRIAYERKPSGARARVEGTPLARILDQPNPAMTDFVLWQTLVAHMLTWGNGYAEIEWDRALRPIALWPITPDKISPKVVGAEGNRRVVYKYSGRDTPIEAEDIIHVPGLGFDGLQGYSVVSMARQSIGLGVAAERYGGSFFGGGAWPGILLEHPKTLSNSAAKRLIDGWNQLHRGPDRAHATAVLEEGMKANKLGIPPDDAQFLQTREFQVVEIARWLNLPPHKLKHKVGERPGGNLESSQIEFLTDTLRPWLVRIEQEVSRKLIVPAQRSTYYVEHLADAILRMDGKARADSYKVYFDMGVLDAEQIAEKENLPKPKPKPKPEPVLALPAPGAPALPAKKPALTMNSRVIAADRANLVEAAERFVRLEANVIRRAVKPGALLQRGFKESLEEFYRDEVKVLRGFLVPAVRVSLACRGLDGDADEVSGGLATWYAERSKEELLCLPPKELADKAEHLLSRWETCRARDLVEQFSTLYPEGTASEPETRAPAPIVIPAPVVNLTMAPIVIPAPVVNVAPAAVTIEPVPAPIVNVNVPVPDVRVNIPDIVVNVPPQMAPEVSVTVPAPVVNVENKIEIPPPRPLKVERDSDGKIIGLRPKA